MKTKPKKLSWKPIKRGHIYCSSACGGGCLLTAYHKAKAESAKEAKLMGKGWTTRVWENLGWHWHIKSPCKRITLSKFDKNRYHAYLNRAGEAGGRWVGHGKTGNSAIKDAFNLARKELEGIAEIIEFDYE